MPDATRYNVEIMALTCYLDAFSGISGDMLVGALADAGADQDAVVSAIRSLRVGATVSFEKVTRCGIAATRYRVATQKSQRHRHLSEILEMIAQADLPSRARQRAQAVFSKLGEAEAEVHQVPLEEVHFHEVGAADSIADVVGACTAFDLLRVDSVVCSPLNLGSGTLQTEHGVLPVPAPATARLLRNCPVYARGPAAELTTPTGAAVAATLASRFGVLPPMKIASTGYGAGTLEFSEHANVLRVILGEPIGAIEAQAVSVMEANIDDLNPQVLAFATERLLESGALDVTVEPVLMKKGRPGHLLRVLAEPARQESLAAIIFAETSTLGLRLYTAERRLQARTLTEVQTRYGAVRIKVGSEGTYAPEYEDCRRLALASGVALKQVIAEANAAYLNRSK